MSRAIQNLNSLGFIFGSNEFFWDSTLEVNIEQQNKRCLPLFLECSFVEDSPVKRNKKHLQAMAEFICVSLNDNQIYQVDNLEHSLAS